LNPAPLTINQTSLMSTHPQLDTLSNGATPMHMSLINQPQSFMSTHPQLNGSFPPPATISPASIPQQNNSFPNGMQAPNAMSQLQQPMFYPQQPNIMSNGYAPGVPFGATVTPMQGGILGQTPGLMAHQMANNSAQPAEKDDKNKQLMKKVGMSMGKAVLKFGTKYALEQIGVDDSETIFLELVLKDNDTCYSRCRSRCKCNCYWV
jgi:hypothetical protein